MVHGCDHPHSKRVLWHSASAWRFRPFQRIEGPISPALRHSQGLIILLRPTKIGPCAKIKIGGGGSEPTWHPLLWTSTFALPSEQPPHLGYPIRNHHSKLTMISGILVLIDKGLLTCLPPQVVSNRFAPINDHPLHSFAIVM